MNRSAPTQGYDDPRKELYRRRVWNIFRHHARGQHVLLMPSIEGLEIDVAIEKGIPQRLIHVVDRNPAIVAHIKRRYPDVNTYGVDVVDACRRIAKKGIRLAAANFDFTGQISLALLRSLGAIESSGVMASDAKVAVTVLRGREHAAVTDLGVWRNERVGPVGLFRAMPQADRQLTGFDWCRLLLIGTALGGHFGEFETGGSYLSANGVHTMLWAIALRFERAHYADLARLRDEDRTRLFAAVERLSELHSDARRHGEELTPQQRQLATVLAWGGYAALRGDLL